MPKRVVFDKDGSLYLNIPKEVVYKSGLKVKHCVDVRYIEGIGIVVALPLLIPRFFDNEKRCSEWGKWKKGKKQKDIGEEFCEVIPLSDAWRKIN